jgi:hypothetical protein
VRCENPFDRLPVTDTVQDRNASIPALFFLAAYLQYRRLR